MSKKSIIQELQTKEISIYKQRYPEEIINTFERNINLYIQKINQAIQKRENEDHLTKIINSFLQESFYYDSKYDINTRGNADSSILVDGKLRVLLEIKTLFNKSEMAKEDNINFKALHEIIFYYLTETRNISGPRLQKNRDVEIKRLIITNSRYWFIFNANDIEQICRGYLEQQFFKYKNNQLVYSNNNMEFYQEMKEYFDKINITNKLRYVYFDMEQYRSSKKNLQYMFKILHKNYLLKEGYIEEIKAHVLNKGFYQELLYIMGLKEEKINGKSVINIDHNIKNSMAKQIYDKLVEEKDYSEQECVEHTFNMIVVWINRLLFIKLFEGQLLSINGFDTDYRILDISKITTFQELNNLFFGVLGKKNRDNTPFYNRFINIPYLNSALFEKDTCETTDFHINALFDLPLKKKNGSILMLNVTEIPLLQYMFDFFNSYKFDASVNVNDTLSQGDIIDAAVLGLIFEKLNGYRDGSYYTPSDVTSYMCRELIEATIIDKIKNEMKWPCNDLFEIKSRMDGSYEQIIRLNEIINSIKICDPAVGSGHFLVSALNHIISIKSELGILLVYGRKELLNQYEIEVHDDVLCVYDALSRRYRYDKSSVASAKIQMTLFNEKRIIIENCLFGVDLNPKAVAICRLRLWIELLKNAYYNSDGVMETLPNIDINIKPGNSLVNKINFNIGLKIGAVNTNLDDITIKNINSYRKLVNEYKSESDKDRKHHITRQIDLIKESLKNEFVQYVYRPTSNNELTLDFGNPLFESIYNNSFEWAIEFPEILDNKGTFMGFDCIIGNPPYFNVDTFGTQSPYMVYLANNYNDIWRDKSDILFYFICRAIQLSKNRISLITSNAFLFSEKGDKLRNYILTKRPITKIINFENYKIFENALIMCCIFTMEKVQRYETTKALVYKDNIDDLSLALNNNDGFFEVKFDYNLPYALIPDSVRLLNMKIDSNHSKLGNIYEIGQGMQTAANDVYTFRNKPKLNNKFIRSRLNGERIKKYGIAPVTEYLLYVEDAESFEDLSYDVQEYLLANKDVLSNRADKKRRKTAPWWNFTFALCKEFYTFEKLWCAYRGNCNCFAYDNSRNNIGLTDTTVIFATNTEVSIKYVLALLNSKVLEYRYKNGIGKPTGNGVYEYFKNGIEKLPIPEIADTDQKPFITIVDKILEAKAEDINADTGILENELDMMVYKLYDLSDDEIQIIESFFS